jgi:hypothetical protein
MQATPISFPLARAAVIAAAPVAYHNVDAQNSGRYTCTRAN